MSIILSIVLLVNIGALALDVYEPMTAARSLILSFVGIFSFHAVFYRVLGFFFTRKFPKAKNNHKYAILIPARNEEKVLGNLLNSIKRQDYPQELLTVFVVADNCTDSTARLAREMGAVCYERFNDREKTKGFALRFLFENIERDYGIERFEGYFIFDSDNLLNRDYITRMNESFDAGEKIITSYRNTKNFDECWVSSTYALHWLRSIRFRHRARSVLHLATNIQGTGFLFANELVRNGWHYTSLTEDRAFTADAVAHGYPISYNDAAEFFDEQPVSLKIAIRQRIRWAKGHLQAFVETGPLLFANIFFGKKFSGNRNRTGITAGKGGQEAENETLAAKVLESLRHRFASFDTLGQLIPKAVISTFLWLLVTIFLGLFYNKANGINGESLIQGSGWLAKFLRFLTDNPIVTGSPGRSAMWMGFVIAVIARLVSRLKDDLELVITGFYVFIMERKRIIKIKWYKKLLYCLTWPSFDIIGRYAMYAALFMKVEWKPIPHESKVTIEHIEDNKAGKQ